MWQGLDHVPWLCPIVWCSGKVSLGIFQNPFIICVLNSYHEILVNQTMLPPGESKEHFCILVLSLWSIYSQHTFPRGVWDFGRQLSLSLSLSFFFNDFKLTEKLQKWFRVLLLYPLPKSTNYLHFSPFVLLFYVLIYNCVSYIVLSCSVMVDSLWPHELYLARLLCPWGFSRQEYWSGLPCPPVLYIHVYIICFLKHCQ